MLPSFNLTQPRITLEDGVNEELSMSSWSVGMSIGDCLDF